MVTAAISTALLLAVTQGVSSTKLQCHGNLTVTANPAKGIEAGTHPLKGGHVEVKGKDVDVVGIAYFDGAYSVIRSNASGIGFVSKENKRYGGFLNRLSGELTLLLQVEGRENSYETIYKGDCTPAKPLF